MEEPIHIEFLVALLIAPSLKAQSRQVVWQDRDLCVQLSKKIGNPQEALLVATAFMIGSFTWKDRNTDLAGLLDGREGQKSLKDFGIKSSMCCYELFLFASLVTGWTMQDVAQKVLKGFGQRFDKKVYINPSTPSHIKQAMDICLRKAVAENLGCPFSNPLHNWKTITSKLSLLFLEGKPGDMEHCILFFENKGKKFILHIHSTTQHVVCQDAENLTQVMNGYCKLYTGMLPWHDSSTTE